VLALCNSHADPRQVRIERLASRVDALTAADAARLPSFREWFPDEVLSPGQMVSLTTVTLLGCRIANARDVYANQADQAACSQMLRHLQALATLVSDQGGCVIKTMNDGLNCVFPNVTSAVKAAIQMVQTSRDWGLELRQAVHQGAAVVATINERLDYFGQTPQVLDELLSQALSNEVLLTDHCWNEIGLMESFSSDWKVSVGNALSGWPNWNIVHAQMNVHQQPT
jgi:eukaryotic-like serine/threonine-protein kinase